MRKMLARGAGGDLVSALQKQLSDRGFTCEIDGHFGQATEAMVVEFQLSDELTPDGIVGPATWAALAASPGVGLAGDMSARALIVGLDQSPERSALMHALDWVGERETRPNWSPRLAQIVDGWWSEPIPPPWCALWASHILRESVGPRWPRLGSARDVWNLARGWSAIVAPVNALPGDLFCMGRTSGSGTPRAVGHAKLSGEWFGPGHVGFIVARVGDSARTIEGNVGNAVQIKTRKLSDLRGAIRWSSWL